MAYTIYDKAIERMKEASEDMVEFIKGIPVSTGDSNLLTYITKRNNLIDMGIWQDKYDFYVQQISDKGIISKEDEEGLTKLTEGIIE